MTSSGSPTSGAQDVAGAYDRSLQRRKLQVLLGQLLFGLLFLGFWEFASGRIVDPFYISSPTLVVQRLFSWTASGLLLPNLIATLTAMFFGFVVGSLIGFATGIVFGRFRFVADVLDPYITALYSIPVMALAPLFIMWFGIGIASKIAVSSVIVFFVVFLNTYSGIREVNPIYLSASRIMGASAWGVMRYVMIPSAGSWMLAGLKVSVPYALVGAVVGELISSNRGIGFLIGQATGLFDTAGVFAGILILALIGGILNSLVKLFESWALRWRP